MTTPTRTAVKPCTVAAGAALALGLMACKPNNNANHTGSPTGHTPSEEAVPGGEPTDRAARTGPVRVVVGDCAGPLARFESGPRPQPFDAEQVETEMAALLADADDRRAALARLETDGADKPASGDANQPTGDRAGARANDRPGERTRLDEGRMGRRDDRPGKDTAGRPKPPLSSLSGSADLRSGTDDADVFGGLLGDGLPDDAQHAGGRRPGWGVDIDRAGPSVGLGNATAVGDLDKSVIRRYIRRKLARIRYCYERELLVKPGLAGTVVVDFTIEPTGDVSNAVASGMSDGLASCIAGVVKTIQFPKPRGGGIVNVHYPFTFRAAGDEPANAPANAPANPSQDSPATDPPGQDSQHAGILAAVDSDRPAVDRTPYQPGKTNPLIDQMSGLEACFRAAERDWGAVVIEVQVDAIGEATAARTMGLGDERTARCVAQVAKTAVFPQPIFSTYRCPVAFGVMPTDAAMTVDITPDAVTLENQTVADAAAVAADSPPGTLSGLRDRLLAQARVDALSVGLEPIAVVGPRIIRPVANAPMGVVNRVVRAVADADAGDWVLAAPAGDGWRLLRAGLSIPVAPVPIGTGGRWGMSPRSPMWRPENAPGQLSVLVTPDKIGIGLSGAGPSRWLAANGGAHDWAALADALAQHRASGKLSSPDHVDISGADTVPYADIVHAIDTANKAGMTDWRLVTP